jgi:hypothetical protein
MMLMLAAHSHRVGAASFAIHQLNTNQFVLVGTTSSDTGAVLIVF